MDRGVNAMGRNKSEFLGAFGKGFQIFKVIVDMVLELGGGDSDLSSLLTDKKKVRQIAEIIVGPKKTEQTEFPVWKTVKVRKHLRSADEARGIITVAGGKMGDWANGMLKNMHFDGAYIGQEFDLVVVSGRDLGFTQNVTRREIYDRAIERGLERCPAELAIWLREQYQEQPLNEWLLIGMEPVADSDGDLDVFHVVHDDGGLWLYGHSGHPGLVWFADHRWLFVRPRK